MEKKLLFLIAGLLIASFAIGAETALITASTHEFQLKQEASIINADSIRYRFSASSYNTSFENIQKYFSIIISFKDYENCRIEGKTASNCKTLIASQVSESLTNQLKTERSSLAVLEERQKASYKDELITESFIFDLKKIEAESK
jgi:hypothetical protein